MKKKVSVEMEHISENDYYSVYLFWSEISLFFFFLFLHFIVDIFSPLFFSLSLFASFQGRI